MFRKKSRKSMINIRKLPFSSDEFMDIKEKVSLRVRANQKHRYTLQSSEQSQNEKRFSFSVGPSMFHSSADTFIVREKTGGPRIKCQNFVEPNLRVKSSALKSSLVEASQTVVPPDLMKLSRFRKILAPREESLCRTCYLDKAFRPKLFKRR